MLTYSLYPRVSVTVCYPLILQVEQIGTEFKHLARKYHPDKEHDQEQKDKGLCKACMVYNTTLASTKR